MVDRLVAVDDADYRLPEPVLAALGDDMQQPSSSTGTALVHAVLPFGGLVPRALDIWDAFDGTGLTYASWIAGIDSALSTPLSAGVVVKNDLGGSSDPSRHMFAYTGGAAAGLHILIVGGQHGDERLSMCAGAKRTHRAALRR